MGMVRRRHGSTRVAVVAATAGLLMTGCNWLQFGGNPQHSGASVENNITTSNVSSLHQLWQVALPAYADGAPAYVEGVDTPSGKHNLALVTTVAGDLLAYDATAGGPPVWQAHHPAGTCKINNGSSTCYTTSSPAVDPNLRFVYTYGLDGYVHKHDIGTGAETVGGGWPVLTTRKAFEEKGSSALTVATAASGSSYLYVTHAGYPGDRGDYQGHVTAVNLATGAVRYFNTLCSNQAVLFFHSPATPDCSQVTSGVWARDGVTYDADTDRLYLVSGNGTYAPAQHQWGDSVLAINPDATGNAANDPVDAYTPSNYQQLQNLDADLGSTAPAVLPTPTNSSVRHLGVQGGKDAKLRLLNLDNLSAQGAPGHTGGEVGPVINVPQGGEVLSAPAVWVNPADSSTWVYVTTSGGVSALRLNVDGAGNPSLATMWTVTTAGTEGSPLVANGVVFVAFTGSLRAYNAVTGGNPLWSTAIGSVHWQSPVIGGGRVFVEDQNGHVTAYGL